MTFLDDRKPKQVLLGSTFLFQGFYRYVTPTFCFERTVWECFRVLVAFVVPNSIPLDAEQILFATVQSIQFFKISQHLPSPQKCLIPVQVSLNARR